MAERIEREPLACGGPGDRACRRPAGDPGLFPDPDSRAGDVIYVTAQASPHTAPAGLTRRSFSCLTPAWHPGSDGREAPPDQGLATTTTARVSVPR